MSSPNQYKPFVIELQLDKKGVVQTFSHEHNNITQSFRRTADGRGFHHTAYRREGLELELLPPIGNSGPRSADQIYEVMSDVIRDNAKSGQFFVYRDGGYAKSINADQMHRLVINSELISTGKSHLLEDIEKAAGPLKKAVHTEIDHALAGDHRVSIDEYKKIMQAASKSDGQKR